MESAVGKRPLLSIVVPCHNEAEAVPLFYREAIRVCGALENTDTELIFVDDGSRDGTLELLRKLAAEDSRVRYLSFSRNFGKEAALHAGLSAARGDFVTPMDADLQDPPALLPEMLRAVTEEGYDCCAARRVSRGKESRLHSFCVHAFYKLANAMTDVKMVDGARDYCVMRRTVADAVLSLPERSRFTKGLNQWVGFKTKWLEFEDVERAAGTTKWSFWKLLIYSFEGITEFSAAPLYWAFVPGLLLLAAFCVMLLVECIVGLAGGAAFTSAAWIILLLLFIGGCGLTAMGILGRYAAKIYAEVQNRPLYLIRETEEGVR